MLKIIVPGQEFYNEKENKIFNTDPIILELEHSLYSLSKWEMKYNRPYVSDGPKTKEEVNDYIKMMTLNDIKDETVYDRLTEENYNDIQKYFTEKMTASTVKDEGHRASNKFMTNEVIYAWMIDQGVPFECDKWHLNRLLMLLKVATKENGPHKQMTKREALMQQAMLNKARRK